MNTQPTGAGTPPPLPDLSAERIDEIEHALFRSE